MTDTQANQLSQMIEKEVRQVIGDLHMQIVVLRCLTELRGQQHPQEQPKPEPIPPQPEQDPPPKKEEPDGPKPEQAAMNGHARYQEKIAR
jgi:hypothetical protein